MQCYEGRADEDVCNVWQHQQGTVADLRGRRDGPEQRIRLYLQASASAKQSQPDAGSNCCDSPWPRPVGETNPRASFRCSRKLNGPGAKMTRGLYLRWEE